MNHWTQLTLTRRAAERVVWFNAERPHEYLDDFTPEAAEKLHYDHRRTPAVAG